MALTQEYMMAVSQGNLLRVKIMLKDSLLVDTTFNQFNEMINYAETRLKGIWISDAEDDVVFSQSLDDLNILLAGLVNNFSKRRVTHLKGMINKLYPPQIQMNQEFGRKGSVIKKTKKVVGEFGEILKNQKKIVEVCSKVSSRDQVNTEDIAELRSAAMRIVTHCDMITRK